MFIVFQLVNRIVIICCSCFTYLFYVYFCGFKLLCAMKLTNLPAIVHHIDHSDSSMGYPSKHVACCVILCYILF